MAIMKFGVLGAGVIGLTTALELQKHFSNAEISIVAEKFNEETTSDGAAGIFRPGLSFSVHSEEVTKSIIRESYKYYEEIRKNFPANQTGVSEVSGYIFSKSDPALVENELISDIVPLYRPASKDELKICPGDWKYGSYYTTILTECRRFLPWCLQSSNKTKLKGPSSVEGHRPPTKINDFQTTADNWFYTLNIFLIQLHLKVLRFQEKNGKVIQEKINSLDSIEKYNFDMIFNCLGFGAKNLFKDRKLVPIRGQVIKVSAPWLKKFFYADYDTYIIPGLDNVTLGGCRNYDSYDLTISPYDSAAIWDRCTKLVPELKNCTVEREWVGFRPHRDPVRIEVEVIKTRSNTLKCVHNYGHGGYGVTTAPGSAKLSVALGIDYLKRVCKL